MSEFISRQKKKSFIFLALGVLMLIISFQNFQYPQQIAKSNEDVAAMLNSSESDIQKTRGQISMKPTGLAPARTQVVEIAAPLNIKLKRAPAKFSSKKKSKIKSRKKMKSKHKPKKKIKK